MAIVSASRLRVSLITSLAEIIYRKTTAGHGPETSRQVTGSFRHTIARNCTNSVRRGCEWLQAQPRLWQYRRIGG
jgi:hypothetical protein